MRALITVACLLLQVAPAPVPAPIRMWRVQGEGRGRPAIDGGTAYFLSRRHEVVALDATSGAIKWRQSTGEPGPTTEGSSVVVAGPVVVAGDYNLAAFDRLNGTFRWRFVPAIGYAPGIYLGGVTRGLVLAGSPAGRLYAVSANSGELVWTSVISTDGRTTVFQPATDGTDVVAGYTVSVAPPVGGVVAVDPVTGHERWRAAFPKASDPLLGTGSTGDPILAGDVVIASAGDGTIYGFDRLKGSLRWTLPPLKTIPPQIQGPFPIPEGPGADFRPLATTWRTLFVGSLRGPVIAYDLTTLREKWRYYDPQSGSVSFGLVSDDRAVYVPFASGKHVALDQFTGAIRWRTPTGPDSFIWPALSVDGFVYLAGGQGGFVAYRR